MHATTRVSMPTLTIIYMVFLALLVSACGGGGGGDGGNNAQKQTLPVENDSQPPSISITSPTADPYNTGNSSISISGTASDDTGVTEISWSNNRGGTGSVTGIQNWSYDSLSLEPGENIITVTAVDGANKTSSDSVTVVYQVNDPAAPSITITSPVSNPDFKTDLNRISISGTSSDNFGVTRVTWSSDKGGSGTAIGTNPWLVNDIQLTTGANEITVTAYDSADNSSMDTITVEYEAFATAETCMTCHNGSDKNDYASTGITNPHPFAGAQNIKCTVCHGGDGQGAGKVGSHVPPPPEFNNNPANPSDKQKLIDDPKAYFNRLTLTGIDKFPDYVVNDKTYSALDYLQFINPGDLRVVSDGRACGECHGSNHVAWVTKSPIATEAGILSGAMFAAGIENKIPGHRGLYQDTAADEGWRAVVDPDFNANDTDVGAVGQLLEFPVISQYNAEGAFKLFDNQLFDATQLQFDLYTIDDDNGTKTNRVKANSVLDALYHEQIAFTCGDCHLGSAGANNRYGDFRSSGCSACHMQYSSDGRSRSTDPNVNKAEPANPDAIATPERPHIATHRIKNVAKTLPNGEFVSGIDDKACAGCHQGSNRTVMQYWGIRLDQNRDIAGGTQYPAPPVRAVDTADDNRLFDKAVGNTTFNGRTADQYIEFEDYDGDGRDDTPEDIHHEAGLGCIDCHGSRDLHGGAIGDSSGGDIQSRQEQVVTITCENCHGTVDTYAPTKSCLTYDNRQANCAYDQEGNPLRHVTRDAAGNYYLISRLSGDRHYVVQTKDTVVPSNKTYKDQLLYDPTASYAMGRADGDVATGIGPLQQDPNVYSNGFSHSDSMDCVSCHASWTNSCIGCHLGGEYELNNAAYRFSNITGERIVYNQTAADFVYQTPVPFQLGVSANNMITQTTPAEKVFYRYKDLNQNLSQVLAFSDRNGNGNNPTIAQRNAKPALGHNVMMAHSIRGRVTADKEGPRYCVACHLNQESLANFGDEYATFRTAMATNDFASLDFPLLQEHIGKNPGNQLNSPLWVHMVAGLGTGLFLFDQNGCPVNPLDARADRQYCVNGAPKDNFNVNNVAFDLDRIVENSGIANGSNTSPMKNPGSGTNKRGGSLYPDLSGPLGSQLIQKLTDPDVGVVLDSWLDANGQPQGHAADYIQ